MRKKSCIVDGCEFDKSSNDELFCIMHRFRWQKYMEQQKPETNIEVDFELRNFCNAGDYDVLRN